MLPAFPGGKSHGLSFSPGDVLASAVLHRLTQSCGVPTGQLKDVSTAGWGTIGFDAENYFYNSMHSTAPGNRWRFNDPKLDELTEAQQVELDPDARKAIFQEIWGYELEKAYRPVIGGGAGFYVYQPWLRGIRFGGALSTTNIYQDWGDIIADGWIDK